MKSITPTYDSLLKKLKRFRSLEKRIFFYKGVCRFVAVILSIILVLLFLESIFGFPPTVKLAVIAFFLLTSAILFAVYIIKPLYFVLFRSGIPSLNDVALKVGSFYKNVDDRLANALQLFQKYYNDKKYSKSLIEESIKTVSGSLHEKNFSELIDYKPFYASLKIVIATLAFSGLFWILLYSQLNISFIHFIYPWRDYQSGQVTFHVLPGDTTVLSGLDVPVKVWLSDSTVNSIELYASRKSPVIVQKTAQDSFYYTFKNVKDSLTYFVSLQDQKSKSFIISVEERPLLRSLKVNVIPPSYSKLQPYNLEENVGDISALKGTQINISALANKTLESAALHFTSGKKLDTRVNNREVNTTVTIQRDDAYYFELLDEFGYKSENPITYYIRIIPDQYPLIQILQPGKDIDLGENMTIPLLMLAQDDYGISNIRLAYQVIPQDEEQFDSTKFVFQELEGINYGQDVLRVGLNWDLSESDLLPTDVVVYYVEVYDNDQVSGPKRGKSKVYRARFPSMYELYQEVASTQDETIREMEEIYDRGQKMKQKLDELSLDMKRAAEMDWEKQQEAEEALKRQQEIKQKLEELAGNLNEMVEKMEKNDLASPETMKKYRQVQELYQEIMTPELEKVMREMAEAIQNLDKNLLQKALEDFKMTEEDFNKSLDRTISLLKKLKIEQKLDQAIKMTKNLAERQQELDNKAQTAADKDRLLKEQQNINQDKQALSELLQELKEEMSEVPAMPEKELNNALTQLKSDSLSNDLQSLESMILSGNMDQFPQYSKNVQKKLNEVSQQLQQAKESMSGEMFRRALMDMKKNSRQLLELSKQQEAVLEQTKELPNNSAKTTEMAEQQQGLYSGLNRVVDKIFALSKENFAISPGINQALGSASLQMKSALNSLEERNNAVAARSQAQAMSSINDAIRQLQSNMQNMMQASGSGMSFQQFMEKMQQMAKGQQGINEQTLQMGLGNQLSLAQQAEMARMSAEQGQVRKSMEELAREAKGMSDVLGDLDQIVKDMKEVEKDFAQNNISRETIERQNRILSRMLDAQRSIREREYSRKRQAESGKDYIAKSPDELPEKIGELENRLQQDLLRAKKEGYTRDYLELIKQYFEALTNQDKKSE
ncbi:hypothetical protein JXQ31_07810 [candidate division KSB1 bacterium]|nr:hypothetical protein [candidate division KSB1 bacterium]